MATLNVFQKQHNESFVEIRQRLIQEFGHKCHNIEMVLTEVLPRYGLQFRNVTNQSFSSMTNKMIICSIELTGIQWYNLNKFIADPKNRKRNITFEEISKKPDRKELIGLDLVDEKIPLILKKVEKDHWVFSKLWGNERSFGIEIDSIEVEFFEIVIKESNSNQIERNKFNEIVSNIDALLEKEKRFWTENHDNQLYFLIKRCSEILSNKNIKKIEGFDDITEIFSLLENEKMINIINNETDLTNEQLNRLIDFAVKFTVISKVKNELKLLSLHYK